MRFSDVLPIPLGDGKNLMLPMDSPNTAGGEEEGPLELDDDAKAKILAVKSKLDKFVGMLN